MAKTRELQQHYGLSGNQIAIEQLRRPEQSVPSLRHLLIRGIEPTADYWADFPGWPRLVHGNFNACCRSWGTDIHGSDHGC